MRAWDSVKEGKRVELGLVQVDIACHSQLDANDRALMKAKSIFRNKMQGIAETSNGKLFNWAGDGGSFMFLTDDGTGFEDLVFSAIQMLSTMHAINQEIAIRTDLDSSLQVRISCDSGIATYTKDPTEITADFINCFIKCERQLGIIDTISITKRVYQQLSSKLRDNFDLFKYSEEVESDIYSYNGKKRQLEILRSLKNINKQLDSEAPPEQAECVEVFAFKGDTLTELSKHAYADVIVEGFENVGGLNLLTTKNALRCDQHIRNQHSNTQEEHRSLEQILPRFSPRSQEMITAAFYCIPQHMRLNFLSNLTNLNRDCEVENFIQRFSILNYPNNNERSEWRDPTVEFQGGESLRFYNTKALGFSPIIGKSTLLDHVFANYLSITRVVGGVPEPCVKQRIFEFHNGEHVEVES